MAGQVADWDHVDDELDLWVLGPSEVHVDGVTLAIGRGRCATLLAWLALHAGDSVGVDRTASVLWPHLPVDVGRSRLSGALSALRRACRPFPLEVHRRSGRVIVGLPPATVDAYRFERAVDTARERLHTGMPAHVIPGLRAALATWRGTPYPELSHDPDGIAEQVRLQEIRLDAVEMLHGTLLLEGPRPGLVAQITALTVEHPARELSWRQLVAALQADGRNVEALRAFQACRSALAADGLIPSAAIRQVEAAVLEGRRPAGELLLPAPRKRRVTAGDHTGWRPSGRPTGRAAIDSAAASAEASRGRPAVDWPSAVAGRWSDPSRARLVVVGPVGSGDVGDPAAAWSEHTASQDWSLWVTAADGVPRRVASGSGREERSATPRPSAGTPDRSGTRPQARRDAARIAQAAAHRPTVVLVDLRAVTAPHAGVMDVVHEVLATAAPVLVVVVDSGPTDATVHLRALADEIVS
jgi:DNA-binding SARP family transcriptional activator